MFRILLAVFVSVFLVGNGLAQEPRSYTDAQGRTIEFPLGLLSFADEVVGVWMGTPSPSFPAARNERNILGEPVNSSLSLGCGGRAVVRFVDNVLVDVPGPDLYVFEIGPELESTLLEISADGVNWIDIGPIAGSTAQIDIAPFIPNGDRQFHYVRLTDRNQKCRAGRFSGADIDAVGAIGAAILISLEGEVLFDFDSAALTDKAGPELQRVLDLLGQYPGARMIVAGHTDSRGSDEYNQRLSQDRADSVATFLRENGSVSADNIASEGHGESRPVASNETDDGRQSNRRVELTIIPAAQ